MDTNERRVDPRTLKLDTDNPRMPDEGMSREDQALEWLVANASVDELVKSIASSGWIDYEPLLALTASNTVIEGNRRLAALRLLDDPLLARSLGVKVPDHLHKNSKPTEIRVWFVESRKLARDFIGFKHINGAFKWDAFAKAKYAAEWLADDNNVDEVAYRLGDGHNTIVRLVNGYKVLRQAEAIGFDRRDITKRFAFSHLYTAITRPAYRSFIGLPDATGLLADNPVPATHREQLLQLLTWLYGQDSTPAVIRSQNPDLKRLAEVLSNRTAVSMLTREPNLDRAYAQVEDKLKLFADAVFTLNAAADNAVSKIGGYEGGDEELEELLANTLRTVRAIQSAMLAARTSGAD